MTLERNEAKALTKLQRAPCPITKNIAASDNKIGELPKALLTEPSRWVFQVPPEPPGAEVVPPISIIPVDPLSSTVKKLFEPPPEHNSRPL
jgi:hypothetical protein